MASRFKQAFLLLIYFLSPICASIIYWIEEPLDSSDLANNVIHRTGSILGIFAFIWMCFNILLIVKIKLIEQNFTLDGIIKFHTGMATISLFFGILHYPLVRLERTYSTFQIRSGTIGFIIFFILMFLAIIFMSNRVIKYKIIGKLRMFASVIKFRYIVNKVLHNIMMLGVFVIFIHTLIAYTSKSSMLMASLYSFFFAITLLGWIYHVFIRRFRSENDPYAYHKASWDVLVPDVIQETNKKWALNLLYKNPSLYPCLQCGTCTEKCPVSEITQGDYNPRSNILAALLGYKDLLLGGEELVIWGCTVCHTCDEECPQSIKLTEIFTYLKNQSIAQGKGPNLIYDQANTIFENAKAIPLQPAIQKRRNQMGLPVAIEPDINEIQTLLTNLGINKKLKNRDKIEQQS